MVLLLKNLLFTVLGPGMVTVVLPYLILSQRAPEDLEYRGWLQLLAMPVGLVGLFVYGNCLWEFAYLGCATPAPIDAPHVLVVEGLYRYVRNPMYLGVLGIILAEVLFFASQTLVLYMAGVFLLFHLFVLLYEEPALLRRFGTSYEKYRRSVPRWIPGKPFPIGD